MHANFWSEIRFKTGSMLELKISYGVIRMSVYVTNDILSFPTLDFQPFTFNYIITGTIYFQPTNFLMVKGIFTNRPTPPILLSRGKSQ